MFKSGLTAMIGEQVKKPVQVQKKEGLVLPNSEFLKKLKIEQVENCYTLTLKEKDKQIKVVVELEDQQNEKKKVTINAVGEFTLPAEVVNSMIAEMIKQINN